MLNPTRFNYRILGVVRVAGKSTPVTIYGIFDGLQQPQIDLILQTRSAFEQGILYLQNKDIAKAYQIFSQLVKRNPDDSASVFYAETCKSLHYNPNFDGVLDIEKEGGSSGFKHTIVSKSPTSTLSSLHTRGTKKDPSPTVPRKEPKRLSLATNASSANLLSLTKYSY